MRWMGLLPLVLVSCSPAADAPKPVAEAPVATPATELVEVFDAARIIRLAEPMGYTATGQAEETDDANAWVELKGEDGETFRAEARHCASHRPDVKCEGISLTARVLVPGATAESMLDYANRFNSDGATVHMYQEGSDLFISKDIVLDGGIPEVNLEVQLAAFSTVLRQNRDFLLRAAGVIE